jgi:subtilase family serine protease
MNRRIVCLAVAFAFFSVTIPGLAQAPFLRNGKVLVPETTVEHPEDVGVRAHTNHLVLVLPEPAETGPSGLSPATLRSVYNLPSAITSTSGSGVIAIVDAYDYPTALADFNTFSKQFGLPLGGQYVCNGVQPCFTKVYAAGQKPAANCGWAQEEALDIEWAHAMAPYAQILLVEAASNSFTDLFQAVSVASTAVTSGNAYGPSDLTGTGSGEVSMSWGSSEFSGENLYDSYFKQQGVVYFASSGDIGGQTIYPSASPNVVAAGGTTLHFNESGMFTGETGWSGSGGGPSAYEPRPSYQNVIIPIVGARRGVPDFSFDANPNSGVSVYDSTSCEGNQGWLVFGGTSVASPSLAGIVNLAGQLYESSYNELSTIYAVYASPKYYPIDFRDVTLGKAGRYSAAKGWDFVTGVGSNLGLSGK